ncbi:hypothetical protein [Anaeromicrobium sediminis]|nr:hypothetical protein [Anaeromicrobium sediminis]
MGEEINIIIVKPTLNSDYMEEKIEEEIKKSIISILKKEIISKK